VKKLILTKPNTWQHFVHVFVANSWEELPPCGRSAADLDRWAVVTAGWQSRDSGERFLPALSSMERSYL